MSAMCSASRSTITFEYIPGTTVDTDQDSGKAEILFDSGVDDDGVSFVIVTDEDDASKALDGDGKRFFEGNVAIDATFEANENDTDDFGSTTFIHFFDDPTVACCSRSSTTRPARSRFSWAT